MSQSGYTMVTDVKPLSCAGCKKTVETAAIDGSYHVGKLWFCGACAGQLADILVRLLFTGGERCSCRNCSEAHNHARSRTFTAKR
jgi:hypothetical protein